MMLTQLIRHSAKQRTYTTCRKMHVDISPKVREALEKGYPIVGLESTIITHGMPFPKNLETAIHLEEIILRKGAVPATVAILKGKVKVGLTKDMLHELAENSKGAVKVSRRDFPYVLSKGLNGGTTVAGTTIVLNLLGIKIFATGGLGGVHRGGETTFDISADLVELGRTPIAVISSGVKSILDIEKTLEYLETHGVCIATFGPGKEFPAFYSERSGFYVPYNVETAGEAAGLIHTFIESKLQSGLLIAVPIPKEYAVAGNEIENAIHTSLQAAASEGIRGKDVTPYVLEKLRVLTDGKSLESNIALVKNNVAVASEIAVKLSNLQNKKIGSAISSHGNKMASEMNSKDQLVVIGGSVLDCISTVLEDSIQIDGRTHRGRSTQNGGGVGRNLADALSLLGCNPLFISALGDDEFGRYLRSSCMGHMDTSCVEILEKARTASYTGILDKLGECHLGVGDMEIHERIDPDLVKKHVDKIRRSRLVVMDANIPQETINFTLQVCKDFDVPVWFEPTDLTKAVKPFKTPHWKNIYAFSPNFNELKMIAKQLGLPTNVEVTVSNSNSDIILTEVISLCSPLIEESNAVAVVTLGELGVVVMRRGSSSEPFGDPGRLCKLSGPISARLYKSKMVDVVSVMGAGDCLAAGFITAMLQGLSEEQCVSVGLDCAVASLKSPNTVPKEMVQFNVKAWEYRAKYEVLL